MNEANSPAVVDEIELDPLSEAISDAGVSIGAFRPRIVGGLVQWSRAMWTMGRYFYATPFSTSRCGIDIVIPFRASVPRAFSIPMTVDPDGDMENDVKTYFDAMRSVWPELMEMIGAA